MEAAELEIVQQLASVNFEVKRLLRQHNEYIRQLKDFEKKTFLTAQEQMLEKKIKLAKAHGRERLDRLIESHRKLHIADHLPSRL
jgi:hypothetical protein